MSGPFAKRLRPTAPPMLLMAAVTFLWSSHCIGADEGLVEDADFHRPGMRFVRISSGEYLRGFDGNDRREHEFHLEHRYSNKANFKDEQPAHRVRITQAFEMSETEVTVTQFRAFVDATEYRTESESGEGSLGFFPDEKDYVDRFQVSPAVTWRQPGFPQSDAHPVVCVSWKDAQAYCQWLSKKEQRVCRLPTEAEWEFACRAGTQSWYSWGTSPDESYSYANVADSTLEIAHPDTTRYQRALGLSKDQGDGFCYTAPVKSFRPNAWGLHDLHGNVWEWCQDRWSADLYETYYEGVSRQERSKVVLDSPCFELETDQHRYGDWRVLRGGAWTCAPASVRSSIRSYAEAGDASVYAGFRVVREIP